MLKVDQKKSELRRKMKQKSKTKLANSSSEMATICANILNSNCILFVCLVVQMLFLSIVLASDERKDIFDAKSLYKPQNPANPIIQLQQTRRKRSAATERQQQLVDACESKMEVLTPYYATNSKGLLRTIVNTELMQQSVQVETCLR